jgi:hypothetical protein
MRSPNIFTNPAAPGDVYQWAINHSEEEESGRDRQIETRANTGNVGLVRQQGEMTPLLLRYTGTILEKAQLDEMLRWFRLCETQTIYFTDFAGDSYEVQISSFKPTRVRAMRNTRGLATNPLHYWRYTIEMHVLRVLAGSYTGFPA